MSIWPALVIGIFLLTGPEVLAQVQTGAPVNATGKDSLPKEHSPTRATILAAVLPGSGQAYNRKYWKIPIVYVGLTAAGFALYSNQKNYRDSKNNYIALTDTLESTVYQGEKSAGLLREEVDYYRRNRDLSVLALVAWHGLTIIDANVDAHFFNWDVSEDLSLRIRPRPLWAARMKPGLGFSLILNTK